MLPRQGKSPSLSPLTSLPSNKYLSCAELYVPEALADNGTKLNNIANREPIAQTVLTFERLAKTNATKRAVIKLKVLLKLLIVLITILSSDSRISNKKQLQFNTEC
jgi:hypothetical protein